MAVVQNIKEKVHLPIYDCVNVDAGKQLRSVESSSTLKFFTNVQGKTKLETNLQSASLLPHYNTFEARALQVVVKSLAPRDTLVIATHRPAAIPYASRIIVMQQGRIVADGERERVLAALRSKVAA